MKIGILTYHRTHNYGGCLQALATRLILEQLGHEVYYVDYWPDYHKQKYSTFSLYTFKDLNFRMKLGYIRQFFKYRKFRLLRKRNFESFHEKYTLPYCKPLKAHFDAVIYGSDQIWRKQSELGEYNPIYFGKDTINTKIRIAFSASMGNLPSTEDERLRISSLLKNFTKISVRESNLLYFIRDLGYVDAEQTIDPTLLIDSSLWDKTLSPIPYTGKKYILVYSLWGDVFDMDSIKRLAIEKDLMIKVLKGTPTHYDTEFEITTAGPQMFISLIKHAEYVFTSSFHGLAFSLIYKKQVFASFKTNADRAKSLLEVVGIPCRYLENYCRFTTPIPTIDYQNVDDNLSKLRKSSIDFLRSIKSN